MSNQDCRAGPEVININSNEPLFYPCSVKISKRSGSCNNINDPHAKICVSNAVKDLNVKVCNLMSRTNETRHIKWHGFCKCKCRLNASVCNNKQQRNKDKCRCECKELILTKEYVIKDLFGILAILIVNVINHAMLENIWIIKVVNAERN